MTCCLCGVTESPTCEDRSCQICIKVGKVDEQIKFVINEATATVRRLLAERCDLRSEQNRAHDPMHRLPVELINYIFELLLPRRDEWGAIQDTMAVMPTYFTSICRSWRDISWSNPSLWSTMHMVFGARTPSVIHFARDWILRSRTLPLTLHIVVRCNDRELRYVLDAISQCSSRWKSLSLVTSSLLQLRAFHRNNFQYHHLRNLRISSVSSTGSINTLVPLLNSRVNLEKIELSGVHFQSLQISWNRLTSATLKDYDFLDIIPILQHGSNMTHCQISWSLWASFSGGNISITHQNLRVLGLFDIDPDKATAILGCLTLPSLQEFRTDQPFSLSHGNLPALVHRSSCPLTGIALRLLRSPSRADFRPFTGVTDLVLEGILQKGFVFIKHLLEEYLPDLLHLTLRLRPFLCLWEMGTIHMLLDRKRLRGDPDAQNERRLRKILVVDQDRASEIDAIWTSEVGRKLKAFGIRLRQDGFEFL